MKEKSTIQDINETLSKKPLERNYKGFKSIALDNGDIKYFANSEEGYFSDKGKRVELGETTDPKVLRTALEHASLKFSTFKLKGTEAEIKALATQAVKMQLDFKIQADERLKSYIESEKKRIQDLDRERGNKLRDASKNLNVEAAQLPAAKMQVEARKLEKKSTRWTDQVKNPPELKKDGAQVYSNDIEHKLPELKAVAAAEKKEAVTEQITPEKSDEKSFSRNAAGEIRANFLDNYIKAGNYTANGQTEVSERERRRQNHLQKLQQQSANLLAAGEIGSAIRTQLQFGYLYPSPRKGKSSLRPVISR